MNFKSVFILILIGITIIVFLQNIELVTVHFLFWKLEVSKLFLLLITLIIGVLTGTIIPGMLKKSKKNEELEKK